MRSLIQSLGVTVSSLLNSLLGLVYYVWIGRTLSVEQFGYFSYLLTIGILASDLMDLGSSSAIVKFGREDFKRIFSVVIVHRLILGLVAVVTAIAFQLIYPANFLLSAIAATFLMFFGVATQSFLAKQKFAFFSLSNIVVNILRLAIVFVLGAYHYLNVESAIGAFAGSYALGTMSIFILYFVLAKQSPFNFENFRVTFSKVYRFGLPLGLAFGVNSLASKIDSLLIYSLSGGAAAGLYSSAQRLVSAPSQFAGSLSSVFSPKMADGKDIEKHFREYLAIAVASVFLVFATIPFVGIILGLIFGEKYLAAVQVLQILLIGLSAMILTGPFSNIITYAFDKTKVSFYNSLLQLAVGLLAMLYLIPRFGSVGAAISFDAVLFTSLVYYVINYLNYAKNVPDNTHIG